MNRGQSRSNLFLDDADRQRFLRLLAELPERFRAGIHAFVLMDNHYHLLLRTPEPNLSHAIRWLHVTNPPHPAGFRAVGIISPWDTTKLMAWSKCRRKTLAHSK